MYCIKSRLFTLYLIRTPTLPHYLSHASLMRSCLILLSIENARYYTTTVHDSAEVGDSTVELVIENTNVVLPLYEGVGVSPNGPVYGGVGVYPSEPVYEGVGVYPNGPVYEGVGVSPNGPVYEGVGVYPSGACV